jgi:hypothetical protein
VRTQDVVGETTRLEASDLGSPNSAPQPIWVICAVVVMVWWVRSVSRQGKAACFLAAQPAELDEGEPAQSG